MTKNSETVDNFSIITIYAQNCQFGGIIYESYKRLHNYAFYTGA